MRLCILNFLVSLYCIWRGKRERKGERSEKLSRYLTNADISPNEGGDAINTTMWVIDDNHAQYWPLWWQLQQEIPISAFNGWSRYSSTLLSPPPSPSVLTFIWLGMVKQLLDHVPTPQPIWPTYKLFKIFPN